MSGKEDIVRSITIEAKAKFSAGDLKGALDDFNNALNIAPDSEMVRFHIAEAFSRMDWNGLAINVLQNLLRNSPTNAQAWCNLGVALQKSGFQDPARSAWLEAISLIGDHEEACANMAGLYADSGSPREAIEWCLRAIRCNPNSIQAHWHKALAELSLHNFSAAWDDYEVRRKRPSWNSRPTIVAADWDGGKLGANHRLYLHGEQGVGDEIMFLSLLPEVLNLAGDAHITVEVNPKVAALARRTWPDVYFITHETQAEREFTHKLPLGSLPRLFWRDLSQIAGDSFLRTDPVLEKEYTQKLQELGPRPWLALAWFGGLRSSNLIGRSIPIESFGPLMSAFTCVSGQYEDIQPVGSVLSRKRKLAGLTMIDIESAGGDMLAQASLFACCDVVITVPQTAMHVAGGVGTPCFVLAPLAPDWRFGTHGDTMPYYKSVRIFRRENDVLLDTQVAQIKRAVSQLHAVTVNQP